MFRKPPAKKQKKGHDGEEKKLSPTSSLQDGSIVSTPKSSTATVTTTTSSSSLLLLSKKSPMLDLLDENCIDILFSFLEAKALFRLAFCSKYLKNVVRHEHVVRSAVFSGGHAKRSLQEIITLMKAKSTLIPSPLRLLRLVNGKYCERYQNCILYDPDSGPKLVNFVRPGFGLFLCYQCLTGLDHNNVLKTPNHAITIGIPSGTHHKQLVQDEKTMSNTKFNKVYIVKDPYYDTSGERVAACITWSEYQRIIENNNDNNAQESDTQLLLEEHIQTHFQTIHQNDPWKHKYQVILETFDAACHDRKGRLEEQHTIKTAQQAAKLIKQVQKMEAFIENICQNLKSSQAREIIKDYTTCTDPTKYLPCVMFRCKLFASFMYKFVHAPSKASKKKSKEVAVGFDAYIDLLKTKNFFDFSFLSNDLVHEPMQCALRNYLTRKYPTWKDVLLTKGFDADAYKLIEEDKLLLAILKIFEPRSPYTAEENYEMNCQGLMPLHVIGEAFTEMILSTDTVQDYIITQAANVNNNNNIGISSLKSFARAVWRHSFLAYQDPNMLPEGTREAFRFCSRHFQECSDLFPQLLPIALEYVRDIQEQNYYPNQHHTWHGETIEQYMVGHFFWSCQLFPGLLLQRDFVTIRRKLYRVWEMFSHSQRETVIIT